MVALVATAALVTPLAVTLSAPPSSAASGTVDVLYAGSLLDLMTVTLGPAFTKATGYTLSGFSAGSSALANEIKGETQVADVFISAAPSVNSTLEGPANGDWVSTYATFGSSPLVLGYNRSSSFAHALTKNPWYDVVDRPGFLLGRTDPTVDPKGVLAIDALQGVALSYDVPALAPLATSSAGVFPETTLVGRLQAGQLDAGFFYLVEARAASLPTVPLIGTRLGAHYTVAIVNRDPHNAAAHAFVKFLLSKKGRAILTANGITPAARATFGAGPPATTTTSTTTTTAP
ncbi:MAG: extracellular solute-binding protein [Acidimicrobiales bacterium]